MQSNNSSAIANADNTITPSGANNIPFNVSYVTPPYCGSWLANSTSMTNFLRDRISYFKQYSLISFLTNHNSSADFTGSDSFINRDDFVQNIRLFVPEKDGVAEHDILSVSREDITNSDFAEEGTENNDFNNAVIALHNRLEERNNSAGISDVVQKNETLLLEVEFKTADGVTHSQVSQNHGITLDDKGNLVPMFCSAMGGEMRTVPYKGDGYWNDMQPIDAVRRGVAETIMENTALNEIYIQVQTCEIVEDTLTVVTKCVLSSGKGAKFELEFPRNWSVSGKEASVHNIIPVLAKKMIEQGADNYTISVDFKEYYFKDPLVINYDYQQQGGKIDTQEIETGLKEAVSAVVSEKIRDGYLYAHDSQSKEKPSVKKKAKLEKHTGEKYIQSEEEHFTKSAWIIFYITFPVLALVVYAYKRCTRQSENQYKILINSDEDSKGKPSNKLTEVEAKKEGQLACMQ